VAWPTNAIGVAIVGVVIPSIWRRRRERRARELVDDALKHLLGLEHQGRRATLQSIAGVLRLSDRRLMALADRLEREGFVHAHGPELHLTSAGERRALQIVRAHRLWERYLADEARVPLSRLHGEADRQEHRLSEDDIEQLDAALGHPQHDPHGAPIPDRDGVVAAPSGVPLTEWTTDAPGRIVSLEDEPPIVYAQILAEGLRVGQIVRVLNATPERILLTDGQTEFRLAPAVAANVLVAAVRSELAFPAGTMPLSDLADHTTAEIVGLDDVCQGFTRRRLLDLGFTPGARVTSEMRTFAGDPRAYKVRGVLIALRREQARQIFVRPVPNAPSPAGDTNGADSPRELDSHGAP
jgi:DtxR family Mn-dependent transcriptional regulator